MKTKLRANFTDLKIEGKFECSPFQAGDEVEVIRIVQSCSDRGCCELEYVVSTPEWNDNRPFSGYKYYDKSEIDVDGWPAVYDQPYATITYYPPKEKSNAQI